MNFIYVDDKSTVVNIQYIVSMSLRGKTLAIDMVNDARHFCYCRSAREALKLQADIIRRIEVKK